MSRPRANVSATVPGTGRVNATANVIATWDDGAPVEYIEEAIKQAARDAIRRVREVTRIEYRPATPPADYVQQLTLPYDGA